MHAHIHARHPTPLLTLAGAMLVEASISSRKPSYTRSIATGIQQFTSHLPRKTSLWHWDPDREVAEVMLVVFVVHELPPGTSRARGWNASAGSVLAMSPSLQPWGALSWLLLAAGHTVSQGWGCPPCLPSSRHHLNYCVFLGQTAKTASAALGEGQLSPLVWAESPGNAQGMEIPLLSQTSASCL